MMVDQKKYQKAMHEATLACNDLFRVCEYFAQLAESMHDNPTRHKQVEQWQSTATYVCNIAHDVVKILSAAYDVMSKWEWEDKKKAQESIGDES